MAGIIELKNISKTPFYSDVNFPLQLKPGNIVSVYSGKSSALTSLLKVISGLAAYDSGEIFYNGTKSLPIFPFIPKAPVSFPWLSVKGNIEYVPDRKKETAEVLAAVGLEGYEDHLPDAGSIGFRFRISLARALSLEPALIIIDDCLDLVDEETKQELALLLKKVSLEMKTAIVYGSSNFTDTLRMSEEVFVLNNSGVLEKFALSGEPGKNIMTILKDINAG